MGSSSESANYWGGADTLSSQHPQNSWQLQINQFVYFLPFSYHLRWQESTNFLWEGERWMHACILGMLILQCKINKNRGQGELGIGTALCQEEDSAVARPRIHHIVIYKRAYSRATLHQPLEGAAATNGVPWSPDCPVHSQGKVLKRCCSDIAPVPPLQSLGPAAPFGADQRLSVVYQSLAIDGELSTACTLLHRRSSQHTSWIHYSAAATRLNDVIKIRHSEALQPAWKESQPENPSDETTEEFVPVGSAAHDFPRAQKPLVAAWAGLAAILFVPLLLRVSSSHPLHELPCFQRHELKQKTPNLFMGNEPLTVTLFQGGSAPKTRHALSRPEESLSPCLCSMHTVFQLDFRIPPLHKDLLMKRKKIRRRKQTHQSLKI